MTLITINVVLAVLVVHAVVSLLLHGVRKDRLTVAAQVRQLPRRAQDRLAA